MATARDICTLALKECGVVGVGQTPLAEDINDAFTLLGRMVAIWQRKRYMIPALMDISALGNGERSVKIGPGQYFNHPRPDSIQAGYVVQVNTAGLKVSIPLIPIKAYEDYAKIAVKDLNSLPNWFFYDAAEPYGNIYAWPIPNNTYELHYIVKTYLGFNTGLKEIEIVNGGSGYIDGDYVVIPVTNIQNLGNKQGYGTGGSVNITVSGGTVTAVTIQDPGNSYVINNQLTVSNNLMGGSGSGLIIRVNNLIGSLDNEFNAGEEYEEGLHYNLAIRLCSMYQLSPQQSTVTLAKVALNTLKNANVQVPTMGMPYTLGSPRAYNIYADYGYGAF